MAWPDYMTQRCPDPAQDAPPPRAVASSSDFSAADKEAAIAYCRQNKVPYEQAVAVGGRDDACREREVGNRREGRIDRPRRRVEPHHGPRKAGGHIQVVLNDQQIAGPENRLIGRHEVFEQARRLVELEDGAFLKAADQQSAVRGKRESRAAGGSSTRQVGPGARPVGRELGDRCLFGSHNSSNTVDAVIRTSHIAVEKIFRFLGV